jgi:hypothetical protein
MKQSSVTKYMGCPTALDPSQKKKGGRAVLKTTPVGRRKNDPAGSLEDTPAGRRTASQPARS